MMNISFLPMKSCLIIMSFIISMVTINAQIVITEIMYNPPESGTDSLEYIELFNNSNSDYNMNGVSFADGVVYTFGDFILEPQGYVVVSVDSAVMMRTLGVNAFEWNSGGLRNSGELITIADKDKIILDSVNFSDVSPWPTEPDGSGTSLELCDVNADNSKGEFWKSSISSRGIKINNIDLFASPGAENLVSCASHKIIVKNFEFDPAEITIKVGESVEWINTDGNHNINGSIASFPDNPEGFFSGPPARNEWSFIHEFTIAGKYDYQCDPHANFGMTGVVNVVEDIIPPLAITEIMYNSPDDQDSLEYLELKNQGAEAISMMDIHFTQGIEYTFEDTMLAPGEYIVLAQNANALKSIYDVDALQWVSGSLNNGGEKLEITSALGTIIDEVIYDDGGVWPVEADGEGRSLVLCDDNTSNDNAGNWGVSAMNTGVQINGQDLYGSPGQINICDSIKVDIPAYKINVVTTNDADGIPDSIDVRCKLRGIVYGIDLQTNGNIQFTLIDDTGGLGAFGVGSFGYTVKEGDELELTGKIDQFNGYTQIAIEALELLSQDNVIKMPDLVTTLNESTEGEFIMMNNMEFVDPTKWQSNGRFFTIQITDGTDQFNMYIDDAVDLSNMMIPTTNKFNVIGIGGQFDRDAPHDEGYQINPRSSMDIIPLTAIKKIENDELFHVSPNPFRDKLYITSDFEIEEVKLYSNQGKLIFYSNSDVVDIQNLENGYYLLQVKFTNGLMANKKIVRLN